ncbi:MAG: PAS domain-containing sensor histidine kinase [Bacteroidetes bacterium]|nr:MAG: PAS domain-containing sensor histidine kinase [Bacteroidota bacterium]
MSIRITRRKPLSHNVIKQVPGIIYQFQMLPDGNIRIPYVHDKIKDLIGVLPKEVTENAHLILNKIHPDDLPPLFDSIKKSKETLLDWEYEFRIINHKGQERWVRGVSKPERLKDGSFLWNGYILDVTERKKWEQEIDETRKKYQGYFENAPDGLFVMDEKGFIKEVNPAACNMTGYNNSELVKMNLKDLVDFENSGNNNNLFEKILNSGNPIENLRLKNKNGNYLWIRLLTTGLHGNYFLTFCHNITQRKKNEHILENQLGFQKLLADISSGFVNATEDRFYLTINNTLKHCCIFFQADRSYVFEFADDYKSMTNTYEWVMPGIEPQILNIQNYDVSRFPWWWEQMQKKKQINIPDVQNHLHLSREEKEILLDQDIQSLLSIPMINNGILIGFLGLDRVKEKKGWAENEISQFNVLAEILSRVFAKQRAEKALKKSENRYRLLAENARDIIYRIQVKPDFYYEYVSPSTKDVLGYGPEAYYNNPDFFAKIVHTDDSIKLENIFRKPEFFKETVQLRVFHNTGKIVWIELKNVPVYSAQNRLIAFEGIARDISALKHSEERLRELNFQLTEKTEALEILNSSLEQRINEEVEKNRNLDHMMALQARQAALGEMIGNIAHQWRQPLNLLSLAMYDLEDTFEYQELDKKYMDASMKEIHGIIQQMSQTIDDFRNYFKPQKEKTVFYAREAVNSALDFMSPYFVNAKVKIQKDLPDEVKILGYYAQFEQVVINILKNAMDSVLNFDPENRIIKVKAALHDEENSYVEIMNTGNPIKEEDITKIFDPYFTTKPEGEGLGLGLYIAKIIIEKNMEGKISFENVRNGVRFILICKNGEKNKNK